jgi:hypothetical protein
MRSVDDERAAELPAPRRPSLDTAMPRPYSRGREATGDDAMGDDRDIPEQAEFVTPPGGPRPRSEVHGVHPGETVRRMPDGSYQIVRTAGDDDDPDDRVAEGNAAGAAVDDDALP